MKEIIERNGKQYFKTSNGGLLPYVEKRPVLIGVYCITDNTNGKQYVGSSKNLLERIAKYSTSSKAQGVLRDIIDINNISSSILEILDNTDNLLERELYYINKLNTIYPNGYNKKDPTNNKFFSPECYVKRSCIVPQIETPKKPKEKNSNKAQYKWRKGSLNILKPEYIRE